MRAAGSAGRGESTYFAVARVATPTNSRNPICQFCARTFKRHSTDWFLTPSAEHPEERQQLSGRTSFRIRPAAACAHKRAEGAKQLRRRVCRDLPSRSKKFRLIQL